MPLDMEISLMETVEMSKKELNIAMVISLAIDKRITQKEAADRLGICTRQIKRLVKKIRLDGPHSIAHNNRGKASSKKYPKSIENKILAFIQDKYYDYGPTLAAEKLLELDGIRVSNEWLRKLMIRNGLWRAKQRRPVIHYPRARRSQYGELIQLDGSHHAWFEDRGPKCVALVFVDDATTRLQAVHFCTTEDLRNYIDATMDYVKKYGCPKEIYTDKHSVFTVNHMRGGEKKGQTHFAKILQELNIKQHLANSPQAKGRVERMNRTLQDRLLKEFRLNNISTIADANAFMPKFIEQFNEKFSKPASEDINAHLLLTKEQANNLDNIFAIKEHRKVSKALTVQHNNIIYAINKVKSVLTLRSRGVKVYEMPNGDIKMFCNQKELDIQILEYAENYNPEISRKELDIKLDSVKYDEENKIITPVAEPGN
jgi:hypothetical protein